MDGGTALLFMAHWDSFKWKRYSVLSQGSEAKHFDAGKADCGDGSAFEAM